MWLGKMWRITFRRLPKAWIIKVENKMIEELDPFFLVKQKVSKLRIAMLGWKELLKDIEEALDRAEAKVKKGDSLFK